MGFGSTIGQVFFIMIFMMVFAQLFLVQYNQNKLQTELFSYQSEELAQISGTQLELLDATYNTTWNTTNFAVLNKGTLSIDLTGADFYIGDYKLDRNYSIRKFEACTYFTGHRCGEIRWGDNANNEEASLLLLYHFNNDSNFEGNNIIENYATTLTTNDLTPSATVTNTTAKFDRSAYFNGASSFASRANTAQNTFSNVTSYTWSFWINPTSFPNTAHTIVSKNAVGTGYSIFVLANGTLRMQSANGVYNYNCTRIIAANTWTHVAIVYVGTAAGQVRFYLNGSSINNVSTNSLFRNDAVTFTLGRNDSTATEYYHGLIDEFALYNAAKTDAEIRSLYRKGLTGTNPNTFDPGEVLEIDAYRNLTPGTYTVAFTTKEGARISSEISV